MNRGAGGAKNAIVNKGPHDTQKIQNDNDK